MNLLAGATVKPLSIALAIAVVLLLASNGGWLAYASVLDAKRATAVETQRANATDRDAWKGRATELHAANRTYDAEFAKLHEQLKASQGENLRLGRASSAALAAARAAETDATNTLRAFMERYANQLRAPDCASALNAVQRFCPALEGY